MTILLGLSIGLFIIWVIKSLYSPKARWIQAVMLFDELYTFIANVEGKIIYKGDTVKDSAGKITKEKWELIDLPTGYKKRWLNIYFFPWPFFKMHTYDLTYTKEKMLGEEKDGDIVIWKDEETKYSVISRNGTSNHLEWRAEYPTITPKLDTFELLAVNVYTNNILEVTNPSKVLFGIKDWFKTASDTLQGGLRGLVAEKKINELNQYSSEQKGEFDSFMRSHANTESEDGEHHSLPSFGLKLFKSVFKDFNPGDEKAKEIMNSFADVTKAEQEGEVKKVNALKEGEALVVSAGKKAEALAKEQKAVIEWRKKYLVETGLAKTDTAGNIIELVPDANVRVGAEALKELAKLTGTLVMDSSSFTKMLSINPTNLGKEEK